MSRLVAVLVTVCLSLTLFSCRGNPPVKPANSGPSATTATDGSTPSDQTLPSGEHDYLKDPVNPAVVGAVVAVVNGEIITKEEVLCALAPQFEKLDSDTSLTPQGRQTRRAQLIDHEVRAQTEKLLLLQEARRRLTEQEKAHIDKDAEYTMNDLVRKAGSAAQLENSLARDGKTIESRRKEEKENLLIRALITREMGGRNLDVRPHDMMAYYDAHQDEFHRPHQVQVRQIFLQFSSYATRSQARERGQDILDRLAKGEDFAALARQYSDDPYCKEGGLWPEYVEEGAGTLRPEVEAVAMKLPIKGTSLLIESAIGYHIVKVEDVRPERQVPFAEVQGRIEAKLKEQLLETKKQEFLERLWKNSYVDIRWK